MTECPYCHSTIGVYTTFTGTQYYSFNGEPAGYDDHVTDNQTKFAKCVVCERKISFERLRANK